MESKGVQDEVEWRGMTTVCGIDAICTGGGVDKEERPWFQGERPCSPYSGSRGAVLNTPVIRRRSGPDGAEGGETPPQYTAETQSNQPVAPSESEMEIEQLLTDPPEPAPAPAPPIPNVPRPRQLVTTTRATLEVHTAHKGEPQSMPAWRRMTP
jgi:hypothetical protein